MATQVDEDEPLIELENHELDQEYQKLIGQISETTERLDTLRRAKKDSQLTRPRKRSWRASTCSCSSGRRTCRCSWT